MLNFVRKTKSIIGNAKVKCESMRITHTRNKSITQYMLDKPLKDVKNVITQRTTRSSGY